MPSVSIPSRLAASILVGASLGSSLATAAPPISPPPLEDDASRATMSDVTGRGRFALVELRPQTGQRDLLLQIVEIAIPNSMHATVGDGLRHVLAHSGYRLCDSEELAVLYGLPLPAAHLHLGPLTLRDALSTIAGPAWSLSTDEVNRIACFARKAAPDDPGHPGERHSQTRHP